MQTNISITKDKLEKPKDWFWTKVAAGTATFILGMTLFGWYCYAQGYVKGYTKGFLEYLATDDCSVESKLHYEVGKNPRE